MDRIWARSALEKLRKKRKSKNLVQGCWILITWMLRLATIIQSGARKCISMFFPSRFIWCKPEICKSAKLLSLSSGEFCFNEGGRRPPQHKELRISCPFSLEIHLQVWVWGIFGLGHQPTKTLLALLKVNNELPINPRPICGSTRLAFPSSFILALAQFVKAAPAPI